MALEAQELWKESAGKTTELEGVKAIEVETDGFKVTTVQILDERGVSALCKPVGEYITIELDGLLRREENAFVSAAELVSEKLRELLGLDTDESVLVVGLGNAAITPDAIGPESVNCVMVTRHLKERMPEQFHAFREVSAVSVGVLGTTGMESADMISAVAAKLQPDRVIAVDALASSRMDRLCRTLQITNTGIVPGSGVGNSRAAINRETLGIPVVAVGVPTVVDAMTMAIDYAERAGVRGLDKRGFEDNMIVTPREIDKNVRDMAKLIGYGVNLALHDGLTIEDVDMFIS